MATFDGSTDLRGAEFVDIDLSGARFDRCDLSDVVVRGANVERLEIDDPWLAAPGRARSPLVVNGVDVTAYVDAELDRRFPGRAERGATDPGGLRSAWAAAERTWEATLDRVAAMPACNVELSVGGEWSFAQTLRHLVMATDVWLRQTIQGIEEPFHPLGQPFAEYEAEGYDMGPFATGTPSYDDVLEARAGRVAMVRDFLATVTPADLAVPRTHPWASERRVSTLSCLHTILGEEWEHHRYAVRDLDAIEAGAPEQRR